MPLGAKLSWGLFMAVNVVCGIVGLLAFTIYRKLRRDKIYSRKPSLVDMWSRRARFEQATPNYTPLVVLSPTATPAETPPEVAPNDLSTIEELGDILFVSPRGNKDSEAFPSYLTTHSANTCGGIFAADDLSANLLVRNYLGFLKGCACVFAFLSVMALAVRVLVIYGVLSRVIGNYVLVLTSSLTFFVAFAIFYWYLEEPYHMSKGVEEAKRTVVLRWHRESVDQLIAEGVTYMENRNGKNAKGGSGAELAQTEDSFMDAVLRRITAGDAEMDSQPRSSSVPSREPPIVRTPQPCNGESHAAPVASVVDGTITDDPPSRVQDSSLPTQPSGSPPLALRNGKTGYKMEMLHESFATASTAAPAHRTSSFVGRSTKLSAELLKHDQLSVEAGSIRPLSLQNACSNPLEAPYGTMKSWKECTKGQSEQPRHAPLIHGIMEAMKPFGEVVSVHLVPSMLHVYLNSLDDVVQTRELRDLQIACCGEKDEVFDVIMDAEQKQKLVLGQHDIVHEDAPNLGLKIGDVILHMKPYDAWAINSDSSPHGPDMFSSYDVPTGGQAVEKFDVPPSLEQDTVAIPPVHLAPLPNDLDSSRTHSLNNCARLEVNDESFNVCSSDPSCNARARWTPAMSSTCRPMTSSRAEDQKESIAGLTRRADPRQFILNVWRPKTYDSLRRSHAMIKSGECDPLCLAFVSFFEPSSAQKALAAGCLAGHKGSSIRMAPPASTVDWSNICVSPQSSALRLALSVSVITLAAYFIAAPTVLAFISTWIRHLTLNITRNDDVVAAVVQLVPFFFLYNVNSILIPALINGCAHFARAWRKDHQVRTKFMVNYVFLVLLLFALPLLKCGTLWQLVKSVAPWEHTRPHPIRIHFGRSTNFTLQYLVSSVFIGNLAELYQFSQALYLFFFQGSEKWKFTLGYWFAYHLSTCTMALTFSAVNSGLLPLGALYFILRYAVDKYLFANDVRPFEYQSDGLTEKLILRVFLFQVTIFLGVTATSFHQLKYPLLGYSLTVVSVLNALVCFWPSLFHFLPKPERGDSHLFRMPNMGKFFRLLALSYRIPVRVASKFASVPEGFTDVSTPWFITVVSPLEDTASDRRRRSWC